MDCRCCLVLHAFHILSPCIPVRGSRLVRLQNFPADRRCKKYHLISLSRKLHPHCRTALRSNAQSRERAQILKASEYDPGYRAYLIDSPTGFLFQISGHMLSIRDMTRPFIPESSQVLRFEPDGTVSSWAPALPSDAGSVYSTLSRLWWAPVALVHNSR